MTTVPRFNALVETHGSPVEFHRDYSVTVCPCRTKQGYRDPEWHAQHPEAPVCNEAGFLPDPAGTTEIMVKAFVQPVQSGAVRRLTSEQIQSLFGEVESDDHLGIFPCAYNGAELDFTNWSVNGKDSITYNGRKYNVVSVNLIPDPDDGNPFHHWEVGLRLMSDNG